MASQKGSDAMQFLEELSGGTITLGQAIESIRKGDEVSQIDCAKKLGISKAHLCDIEKGRRTVSSETAARWAAIFGYPESVLVRLALQAGIDAAGLHYKVSLDSAASCSQGAHVLDKR